MIEICHHWVDHLAILRVNNPTNKLYYSLEINNITLENIVYKLIIRCEIIDWENNKKIKKDNLH